MTPRQRGRKWMERRAQHLRMHPLCVHCIRQSRVTAAQEVDHVIALANGGKDTDDNLQSLCIPCHQAKTAKDMGYTQRNTIGIDGWPVDGGGE